MSRALFGLIAGFVVASLSPPALADALDRIESEATIRFGVRAASAPFSFRDETGAAAGLAVALCDRVALALERRMGQPLAVEYVTVDAASRFTAITGGEVDVHCGPMTATLTRRETLDFSVPYFMDGIGVALRREGPQDVGDLGAGAVGALGGTTSVEVARRWGDPGGSPLVEFASHEDGLRALGRGELDAYFGDQGLLLHQLGVLKREDRLIPIRVMDDQFSYEPYALAMKAGEGRLRLEVDRALSEIFLSQEIFTEVEAALGDFQMSELAAFIYVLVALPD